MTKQILRCMSCALFLGTLIAVGQRPEQDQQPAGGLAGAKERMRARLGELADLKREKRVGENRVGLLEVMPAEREDEGLQRLVDEENRDRSTVYRAIAEKAEAAPEQVGRRRARQIYDTAAPGVMLQRADGSWFEKPERRAAPER